MTQRLVGFKLPPHCPVGLGLNLVSRFGVDVCIAYLFDSNFYCEGYCELLKRSVEWASRVCGHVTPSYWGADTIETLRYELSMAGHLGLSGVIVPLPSAHEFNKHIDPHLSNSDIANTLLAHCNSYPQTRIVFEISEDGNGDTWARYRSVIEELNLDPFGSGAGTDWSDAGGIRSMRGAHGMINAILCKNAIEDSRWLGERVSGFVLSPLASACWNTLCVSTLLEASCSPMLDLSDECLDDLFGVELLDRVSLELSKLNDILFPLKEQMKDEFCDLEDCLQLPLQPLGDHLPNPTYAVFEADEVKYTSYQLAMEAFLKNRLSSSQMLNTRVAILGAGRGPLVSSLLRAASVIGGTTAKGRMPLSIIIIEKSPHACRFLKLRHKEDPFWVEAMSSGAATLEIIEGDGRTVGFDLGEKARGSPEFEINLLVSELLGSFGDNELSPECIEGFMRAYTRGRPKQEASVVLTRPTCIPQEYTSVAVPVYSAVLQERVRELFLKGGVLAHENPISVFHTTFVVKPRRFLALSIHRKLMTFSHDTDTVEGFNRTCDVVFEATQDGVLNGFLGFFECLLYDGRFLENDPKADCVFSKNQLFTLSTNPATQTRDMYSWFPVFIPLLPQYRVVSEGDAKQSESLLVKKGDTIRLVISRMSDDHSVWYEWQAFVGLNSSLPMNPRGQFSKIRL